MIPRQVTQIIVVERGRDALRDLFLNITASLLVWWVVRGRTL